jgi:hypothetical protein
MVEQISLSPILPSLMLSEQVLCLKGRTATAKMAAGMAEKLRDQPPEMEEIEGRWYPRVLTDTRDSAYYTSGTPACHRPARSRLLGWRTHRYCRNW